MSMVDDIMEGKAKMLKLTGKSPTTIRMNNFTHKKLLKECQALYGKYNNGIAELSTILGMEIEIYDFEHIQMV